MAEAQQRFSQSRFTHLEYACCYWVDHLAKHLTDSSRNNHNQPSLFGTGGEVMVFLWKYLLYWLEVLSLLGTSRDKHNQSRVFNNRGEVKIFFWKHLLHWLEVSSLLGTSRDKHDQLNFFDNRGKAKVFLQEHLLHWLEVLSVLGKVSEGALMFNRLKSINDVSLLMGYDYRNRY